MLLDVVGDEQGGEQQLADLAQAAERLRRPARACGRPSAGDRTEMRLLAVAAGDRIAAAGDLDVDRRPSALLRRRDQPVDLRRSRPRPSCGAPGGRRAAAARPRDRRRARAAAGKRRPRFARAPARSGRWRLTLASSHGKPHQHGGAGKGHPESPKARHPLRLPLGEAKPGCTAQGDRPGLQPAG